MIETARLALSAWTQAERDPFIAMCADPEVMHDYGGAWDRARAEQRFERHLTAFARNGCCKWVLRDKSSGGFLGYCGLDPTWPTLPVAPGLEIGWRLNRAAWGQGYATEAARAALTDIFARTDAAEVISFTSPTNARSLAVMARLRLIRDASRDFVHESGDPAVVFVAPRSRYAAGAEGET
ncbi:MAG TPA: GNAT family N-acetyltransferase [Caulobacteraceae bacterium]